MSDVYLIEFKDFKRKFLQSLDDPQDFLWIEEDETIRLCGLIGGKTVVAYYLKEEEVKTLEFLQLLSERPNAFKAVTRYPETVSLSPMSLITNPSGDIGNSFEEKDQEGINLRYDTPEL